MSDAAVKQFERLPSDILPVNYKVEIQPDLNVFTFKGKLEITAKVHIVHAEQLSQTCSVIENYIATSLSVI